MNEIVIGSKILDVVTTGMYPNALDAIREYIQNSFDAVRRAESAGVLKPNFGEVTVTIDPVERIVNIRDNGIGIGATEARSALLSIGASQKRVGNDAGFRGIGRLAGLAYCDKLVFTTAAKEERSETELAFDAAAIRRTIAPTAGAAGETATELLERLTSHQQRDRKPGPPFFEVRLVGVDPTACPFLDVDQVRTYLRQVAPVEFNMQAFVYGNAKINPFLQAHKARKVINLTVAHNGRQDKINKPYKTYHDAGNRSAKRVEIDDIETYVDPSPAPLWIAWLCKAHDLTGSINSEDLRGIRLRANNIQVGDERTFARIFEKVGKSHVRFNSWFSGEVHILDSRIIPNSRRDFFEDNEIWREAERGLINWADTLVKRAYQSSNKRTRPADRIEHDADEFIMGTQRAIARGYVAEDERQRILRDITEQEERIEKAISPDRNEEENAALRRKRAEVGSLRDQASKPRSFIDESELNRHERRILRLVMSIVYKVCGSEHAKKVAEEINRALWAKGVTEGKGATQANMGSETGKAAGLGESGSL